MNALDGLLHGLQAAITPTNLLWLIIGCLLGTLVGILPGLGPPATISILLPLATGFDPATGSDHDGRHLLRRQVRRLDHVDPAQHSR